jgi:hypothetical protein
MRLFIVHAASLRYGEVAVVHGLEVMALGVTVRRAILTLLTEDGGEALQLTGTGWSYRQIAR